MDYANLNRVLKKSRRGVAPIIATLLMVAIAVVGGVLIYVYTQGFFAGTSTAGTAIDTVTMTGYDFRETGTTSATVGIVNSTGYPIKFTGDYVAGNGKVVCESGVLFIKNVGSKDTTISKLEVNGVTYTVSAASALPIAVPAAGPPTVCTPAEGTYYVLSKTAPFTSTGTSLPQGDEVNLIVSFNTASAAASGKTITVDITTTGGTFSFHPVIGQRG